MRFRLFAALTAVLGSVGLTHAADPVKGRDIDVAICIDTSGSMDGLIDSAKIKLWTIVNDLAKIQPTPNLRVSLYQFGNDGISREKGWVKKELDLTTDLDEIYKVLNGFKTNGGTEYATRVARDAIKELKWSGDKDALKLIFVCGNEPATQDRETTIDSASEMARKEGIIINTIYCGRESHPEANAWREFATKSGGKYANIDQDRAKSQVVVKTPHDVEILKLSEKLNSTYVFYGRDGKGKAENQLKQDANAIQAPAQGGAPGAALERASTKATALYRNSAWDIVDRMKDDPKFDIKTIKEEELCDELRKLKPEERTAYIKKKAEERAAIQKQIQELSTKRSEFIQEEMKKQPQSAADKAFDDAIKGMIREQAASKGIKIPQ